MTGQSTIVACGSIAYPVEWRHAPPEKIKALGVSKVMTMTSTYDHRVIQGAESGSFLRRIEELLQGEDDFYESVADGPRARPRDRHRRARRRPPRPRRWPPPGARRRPRQSPQPDVELLQAVQAATSLLKAYRTHGHLAARLDPLGSEPKGDPAIQPENLNLTPELMSADPGLDPAHRRPRRDPARGAAADARGLLRHDRLPVRAPLLAPAADLAAGDGRDRLPPQAARPGGEARAARPPDRRLRVRALPREGLPRSEDVLDRGSRRGRADARRGRRRWPIPKARTTW